MHSGFSQSTLSFAIKMLSPLVEIMLLKQPSDPFTDFGLRTKTLGQSFTSGSEALEMLRLMIAVFESQR